MNQKSNPLKTKRTVLQQSETPSFQSSSLPVNSIIKKWNKKNNVFRHPSWQRVKRLWRATVSARQSVLRLVQCESCRVGKPPSRGLAGRKEGFACQKVDLWPIAHTHNDSFDLTQQPPRWLKSLSRLRRVSHDLRRWAAKHWGAAKWRCFGKKKKKE